MSTCSHSFSLIIRPCFFSFLSLSSLSQPASWFALLQFKTLLLRRIRHLVHQVDLWKRNFTRWCTTTRHGERARNDKHVCRDRAISFLLPPSLSFLPPSPWYTLLVENLYAALGGRLLEIKGFRQKKKNSRIIHSSAEANLAFLILTSFSLI